jgi:hypothetical protein
MANGYEKLARMIKESKNQSNIIFKGTMTSPTTCRINKLILDRDDLLIAEHLTTGWYKSVSERVEPLKSGDIVIVIRLDETTYAILERVV